MQLAQTGANLAGANPTVTSGIANILGMILDPVPPTPGDMAGKAVNLAIGLTPLGPFNTIMNLLTGKTIGTVVKGAMTPVNEVNVTEAIVQQANQQAQAQGKDPMDVLMTLTGAFGTAAPPPPTPAAPSDISTPPPSQLAELAISMIGMPEPDVLGAPSSINTPPATQMAELAESLTGMPEPSTPSAPSAPATEIGLDLSSISSGIAGFGMDVGFSDNNSDVGSNDGAPSSPSDGDGTAY